MYSAPSIALRILILALGMLPMLLQAQRLDPRKQLSQYNLQVWQKEQGLPQSTVHAMVQTRDGYLWVATYKGLARYDGSRFYTFTRANTPELKLSGILSLAETKDSTLWIGTNGGGLSTYKDGVFKTYTIADGLSSNIIISIYQDRQGTVWIGTRTGITKYQNGKFTALDPNGLLANESILSVLEYRANEFWVGTHSGFFKVAGGKAYRIQMPGELGQAKNIYAIIRSQTGEIWLATDLGLVRYSDGNFKRYTTADGLSENQARVVFQDRGGMLWVGTLNGGLNRLQGDRFTYLNTSRGVRDGQVISIIEDREGNIWFGTKLDGLYRLSEGKFLNYGQQEGLPDENVNGIVEDEAGIVWLGTSGQGLVRYDKGNFINYTVRDGLANNFVRSIHLDPDGTRWIGTYGGGISIMQGQEFTSTLTVRNGLADDYIRCMAGSNKTGLWIGTRNGLNLVRSGTVIQTYNTTNGLKTNSILSLVQDPDSSLWIGTDGGGLTRLDKQGRMTHYGENNGLLSGVIMVLYYDRQDHCLWIGTNNGLNRLLNGKFDSFPNADGNRMNSEVFLILEDDEDNFWLGSNDGIFCINKRRLNEYAAGKLKTLRAEHFTELDGMRSSEITPNCYPNGLVASDGRLWFPTNKGVSVVDTRRIPKNSHPPLFKIETVTVNGKKSLPVPSLDLPAGSKQIDIDFAALTFVATGKSLVQYKLEGYDDDWTSAEGRRMVSFNNLWPGKYTFRVRGANNDGIWNEVGASQVIFIQPFFYQTFVFWLLISMVSIGLIWSGFRYNTRRLQRRNAELEQKVLDRTREIETRNEQLKLTNQNITLLGQIGQEITTKLSQSEVYNLLQGHLGSLLPFEFFGIDLYEPESRRVVHAFNMEGSRRLPTETISVEEPRDLSARCILERRPIHIVDWEQEKRQLLGNLDPIQRTSVTMRSQVFIPLLVQDRILGCLTVQNRKPDAFAPNQLEALRTLAAYAAIALDNARAYQTLSLAGAEIARQNRLLEDRNAELAKAMQELHVTQDKLILSEKMAALGALVANIAHEINTPISAVATTARNSQRFLPELVYDLPRRLQQLPPNLLRQFYEVVNNAMDATPYGSTREEREGRKVIRAELDTLLQNGHAEEFSLKLVQMNYQGSLAPFKELLELPDASDILHLAANLVQLYRNNDLIAEATTRTAKIISALKAYTHLAEESVRIPVKLNHSIDGVLARHFEKELHNPGIVLQKQFEMLDAIALVPDEIDLVWTNLLNNAFQAINGKGKVSISIFGRTIGTQHVAVVEITDTGMGIPEEILPKIFDPFFTTRPSGEGAGLGLDITRKIIEKHNGRIEVSSSKEGTTFRVVLSTKSTV